MKNRKSLYIVIVVGLCIIIGLAVSVFRSSESVMTVDEIVHRGVSGDPLDIALDFFDAWLSARQSTTTDPYQARLFDRDEMGVMAGERLLQTESDFRETGFDPVLCQSGLPEKFRAKEVFVNETGAQILIMPKEKEGGIQSVVDLSAYNDLWEITAITCGNGEQAPEIGEYSFDITGFLLRQSVQPPLDPQYWHLVFEQNGVLGYTAPLFFGAESVCSLGSNEELCSEANLAEVMQVRVQGQMTEAGVDVARVELVAL